MTKVTTTAPATSPWGQIDHREQLARGVFWVSTPSHGGLMVHAGVANARLSEHARQRALLHGRWLCFEEDCQYALAFYEQPAWRMQSGGWSTSYPSEDACRQAMRTVIERWYPEYFSSPARHTPGPWQVVTSRADDGRTAYRIVSRSDQAPVASVERLCGAETEAANARLLALAPRMSEALLAAFSLWRTEIASDAGIHGAEFLEDFLAWRADFKDVLNDLESRTA